MKAKQKAFPTFNAEDKFFLAISLCISNVTHISDDMSVKESYNVNT